MEIKKILISLKIQEKLFKKHNIKREEIEAVFLYNEPYYFKTRSNRYITIGFVGKYITIVFVYDNGIAKIVTAYESSKWQKNLYKKKK